MHLFPPGMEEFFMEKTISLNVGESKTGKLVATAVSNGLGIIAFLFLFGPLVSSVLSNGTEGLLSMVGLFSGEGVFSVGFLFSFLFLLASIGFGIGGYFKKDLGTVSMILYFLTACFFICVPSFYDYALSLKGLAEGAVVSGYGWALIVVIVLCFIAGFGELIIENKIDPLSISEISEMAVLIGLAVVLDIYVSIDIGPTGGSLNFCIIPLYLIALRSGPAKGFVAGGIVFGFLTCLTDGYGFYFFPFDYLIGWGSIGIIGFFHKWIFDNKGSGYTLTAIIAISLSALLSTLVRMLGSSVSSIIFYGYTFWEAMAYNATYCLPTMVLGIVVVLALYLPLKTVNNMYKVRRN